jgi:hypothetical protein
MALHHFQCLLELLQLAFVLRRSPGVLLAMPLAQAILVLADPQSKLLEHDFIGQDFPVR